MIRRMIMNEIPFYPALMMNQVDVKDCALAHLRAMERPGAANKRFILSLEDTNLMVRIADTLQTALDKNGYDYALRRRTISTCCLRFFGLFSRDASSIVPMVQRPARRMINTQSREVLGI